MQSHMHCNPDADDVHMGMCWRHLTFKKNLPVATSLILAKELGLTLTLLSGSPSSSLRPRCTRSCAVTGGL